MKATKQPRDRKNGSAHEMWVERKKSANALCGRQLWDAEAHEYVRVPRVGWSVAVVKNAIPFDREGL